MIDQGAYADLVGEGFKLADGTELVLTGVSEPVEQGPFTTWSLTFFGPGNRPLAQGGHRLAHPAVGEEEIFLVPIGPSGDSLEYEAVFSRATEEADT